MRPVALLSVLVTAVPVLSAAEATRTLQLALSGDPARPFAVENLVGTMRIVPSSGDAVTAVAVLHAESEALAASVRFEQVSGDKGVPTLRVRYPVDRYTTYRSPSAKGDGGWLLGFLFDGGSEIRYDGVRVRVARSSGVLLYADVEVRLPRRDVDGRFLNRVGPMTGREVGGTLRFDTGSGGVTLEEIDGTVVADTGSGDVSARSVRGSLRCDTGSGDCSIESFKGTRLSCDTGSGDVKLHDVDAQHVDVDTGSGEVRLENGLADEVEVDTGSGDVALQADGARLRRIKADTGSGSVHLRLGADAAFEARADVGSGDIVSRYQDAQPIVRHREIIGYRRGDGHTRIEVDTGSGDLVLEPGD